jgi:hypothetical protein
MYTRGDEVEVASVVISIIRVDVTLSEARRDDISEEDWDIVTRLSVKLAKRSSMLLARSTKVISCGLLSPDAGLELDYRRPIIRYRGSGLK